MITTGTSMNPRKVSPTTLIFLLAVLCLAAVRTAQAGSSQPPLATVANVDLQRYMGTWYEIARLDHFFQKGCASGSATYTMQSDGEIKVLNRCRNIEDGKERQAKGRAWSVEPKGNARLKVSFFWPFSADYWIIELGKNYEYAVVGAPDRDYLWILARQKTLDDSVYQGIVARASAMGFPVQMLVRK